MKWFISLSPVWQSLIATLFTYLVTAFGAASVFLFKKINQSVLDLTLGFAAGVMIAASFWSLLNPALELSEELGYLIWLFPGIGFLCGGLFVILSDAFLDKVLSKRKLNISKKRSILLVSAITIHNIPEGLAIGVAFGGIIGGNSANIIGACLLALGVGLQNFPEGAGVSLPLLREGNSRFKSFFYGQGSGLVEPIAGVIGALLSFYMKSLLPFLLSFAAGCMISVACRELMPEASKENKNKATIGLVLGFVLMMILDIVFSF